LKNTKRKFASVNFYLLFLKYANEGRGVSKYITYKNVLPQIQLGSCNISMIPSRELDYVDN
jgi:hypothetical protein